MTVMPAASPVNFNLAVETLRRTLKSEKVAAAALSQAQGQAPPDPAGFEGDEFDVDSISNPGRHVNTDA